MEPIRVLQIVTTLNRGGLETMLMNYYRHMDRNKVQFDFLLHRQEKSDYEAEAISLGANIYRVPSLNPFSPTYYLALNKFFSEHHYDIVHCHLDCMSAIPLAVAKHNGIKHRFAHAHSNNQDKNIKFILKQLLKKLIPIFSTELFSCSNDAGFWMFDKNDFQVINNAIDAQKYIFNNKISSQMKNLFNLNNKVVIGHIGRFSLPKNHIFLLDIFKEILKMYPNAHLLLCGKGEKEEQILNRVKELHIENSVSFLGIREDIHNVLQTIDIFIFPSIYEGLGIAAIEAQAAGLPCLLSDTIPKECKITDNVEFLSLNLSPKIWAKHALKYLNFKKQNTYNVIKESGFDIFENAKNLQNLYLSKVNNNE